MSLTWSLGYLRCVVRIGLLAFGLSFAAAVPTSAENNDKNPCESLSRSPPTPYRTIISELTRSRHDDNITHFINTFDENKKTIILVHGGMGSELWQTRQRFDPKLDPVDYEFETTEVWLNFWRLLRGGALRQLKIGHAQNRDYNDKIIVADNAVFAPIVKPYKKALSCFQNTFGFNTYLLAWDSRRDLMVAVEELHSVIELIKTENMSYDMRKLFIVGHSMGGMVAKLFFETNQNVAREIGGMISVGTPFYGMLGQLRWMFNGEPLLNNKGPIGNKYKPKEVAGVFASVPGFYTLLPIDAATYEETWNQCKETRPSWCELWPNTYPVTDLDGNIADAYGDTHEYPAWVRRDERGKALPLRQCLARPLPESLAGHIYHIRVEGETTPVTARWRRTLCPESQPHCDYDATQDLSPIPDTSIDVGPGDGTIPYWSAALASTNEDHVINLKSGSHMILMTKNAVLGEIYNIVTKTPPSSEARPLTEDDVGARCGADLPPMATRQELEEELKRMDETDREALQNERPLPVFWLSPPARWRFFQELGR
jgi:pimeloyl-ACP methyl ester carboxylesterase